jgi:hypothetical protein
MNDPGKQYGALVRGIREYKALAAAVSMSVIGFETIRVNGHNLYSMEGRYVSRPLIPGTPCYRAARSMKDRFTRQAARLQKQLDALGPNPHDTFHPLPAQFQETE